MSAFNQTLQNMGKVTMAFFFNPFKNNTDFINMRNWLFTKYFNTTNDLIQV